jgi:hypothetical protein
MHFVLHELTCAMNKMLNNKLKWLKGNEMVDIMARFKDFCDLPSIYGAIVATYTHLQKPKGQHFVVIIILSSQKDTTFSHK